MKKIVWLSILFSVYSTVFSQTIFYNNGEEVYVVQGTDMIVTEGDYQNENGITENHGQLIVEGNYINNAQTKGGVLGSEYVIYQDWENNLDFDADSCNVILEGAAQSIKGIAVSTFYDLTLENGAIKTQEIDAEVSNTLFLNDCELATTDFKMIILNPDIFAIDFLEDIGFVSSTNDGRLVRTTNSNGEYIFPVGETNNGLKYRPIAISPSTASVQQFETRLVYDDATNEGYPLSNIEPTVDGLNQNFFHYIAQTEGTDVAALTIYYDASVEGEWTEIARYESTELWMSLENGTVASSGILDGVTKEDWESNGQESHILINTQDIVIPPTPEGETYALPNVFTPLGTQGENTTFGVLNQNGLVTVESMQIFNRWGEEIFNGQGAWDGYYKGELQPTGNYAYLIQMRDNATGELLTPTLGNILLIW
ncbi:MAG: gliding motility-associated C-terminal domain-containing protein [Chitinophagales bacterium]